ncbi:MAG: hypothetical protein AVDCRST_MAG25-3088 [uncultured Rubrobacteraceae bacterium]|uniref:Uncharacterized protein n=1 Tax=uncultured Rubrobacteraceae bacterium TaxID=349277 RepID=A0A6J4S0S0_9ACTN|nr:MAG: hypothetical protein AVDCRST_MAG25-3088 [uncultured Rubrobacteraceae bacterium]
MPEAETSRPAVVNLPVDDDMQRTLCGGNSAVIRFF